MRYLLILLFFITATHADAQPSQKESIKAIESTDNPQAQQSKFEFPDCQSLKLVSWVKDIITEQEKNIVNENVIDKRARLLAKKYINDFSEQTVATFSKQENPDISGIIITAKINQGYQDSDFRICATNNPLTERKVYLLMQRYTDSEVNIHIINYIPNIILKNTYKI